MNEAGKPPIREHRPPCARGASGTVGLSGKRILIVEDHGLIGDMIAEIVGDMGCHPIGPVMSVREALDVIDYDPNQVDGAVLDVCLNGLTFAVADRLHAMAVPFVFATGHIGDLPQRFEHVPVCYKPYSAEALVAALSRVIAGLPGGDGVDAPLNLRHR